MEDTAATNYKLTVDTAESNEQGMIKAHAAARLLSLLLVAFGSTCRHADLFPFADGLKRFHHTILADLHDVDMHSLKKVDTGLARL
ncbi:hypothetical protein GX50_04090 [[Emmonsia] crescens]|uniref:Uncharacterized protein n=1 Tax=[Emmonsia] crescens TaxID=73230 RepID=A0A2B7ZJV5_9EURO|nr:hypothetical protein GX50_04090 [Emmonsia crescens]